MYRLRSSHERTGNGSLREFVVFVGIDAAVGFVGSVCVVGVGVVGFGVGVIGAISVVGVGVVGVHGRRNCESNRLALPLAKGTGK